MMSIKNENVQPEMLVFCERKVHTSSFFERWTFKSSPDWVRIWSENTLIHLKNPPLWKLFVFQNWAPLPPLSGWFRYKAEQWKTRCSKEFSFLSSKVWLFSSWSSHPRPNRQILNFEFCQPSHLKSISKPLILIVWLWHAPKIGIKTLNFDCWPLWHAYHTKNWFQNP